MSTVIGVIILIFFILMVIGASSSKKAEERGEGAQVIVRKYKTTSAMQRDMNRLEKSGWKSSDQTAAAGFITGTRSYTITYRRNR